MQGDLTRRCNCAAPRLRRRHGCRLCIYAALRFVRQGSLTEARLCYQTVLSLDPENRQARQQLAELPIESAPVTAFTGVPESRIQQVMADKPSPPLIVRSPR